MQVYLFSLYGRHILAFGVEDLAEVRQGEKRTRLFLFRLQRCYSDTILCV
jgi:hypothetical protein